MNRFPRWAALAAALALPLQACTKAAAAPPPAPAQASGQAGPRGTAPGGPAAARAPQSGPKPYAEVITDKAVTQTGMFKIHKLDDKVFFEIPAGELGKEMLLIGRPLESTTQSPSGFFGGGPRLFVQWERQGNRVILRERQYDLTANPNEPVTSGSAIVESGVSSAATIWTAY